MGLEFLDVTNRVSIAPIGGGGHDDEHGGEEQRVFRITNTGTRPLDTHLLELAVQTAPAVATGELYVEAALRTGKHII